MNRDKPTVHRVLPVYAGSPRRYPWRLWDYRRKGPLRDADGQPEAFHSEEAARQFARRTPGLLYEPERAGA